jgi:predicted transcriptional regulator
MSDHQENRHDHMIALVSKIVAGYVSHNNVPPNEITSLVNTVHQALLGISGGTDYVHRAQEPAIAIKKSITPDYLICLEDGKKFKSLKRHLRTRYNMTPDEYRQKWGLPPDYPMVAPNYATARSNLALAMGLGQKQQSDADQHAAE